MTDLNKFIDHNNYYDYKKKLTDKGFLLYLEKIITEHNLPISHINLILYLKNHMNLNNFVIAGQQQLSKDLKVHQSNISRNIKSLCEKQIIKKIPGTSSCYEFPYFISYKN